jgi:MoxR-like ATPase
MAIQSCKVCGTSFDWPYRGRPRATCDIHTPNKGGRTDYRSEGRRVEAPEAIDNLPEDADNTDSNNDVDRSTEVITDDDHRPNFYPGNCHYCERHVPKEGGYRFKVDGKWAVRHTSCFASNADRQTQDADTDNTDNGTEARIVVEHDAKQAGKALGMLEESVLALIRANLPKIDESSVRGIVKSAITEFVVTDLPNQIRAAGVQRIDLYVDNSKVDVPETAHELLPKLIMTLMAGEHVFMPGPAGSGKSTLAMQAAKALGREFYSLSLGPTTQPNKLFGFMNATGVFVETPFYWAYRCTCDDETYDPAKCECGHIFLIDEIDNGNAGIVAELNQALANGYAAFANGMVRMGRRFVCIATGNTFGNGPDAKFVGRNKLDAATLDRFTKLEVTYDEALETRLAMAWATDDTEAECKRWIELVQGARKRAADNDLQVVISPRTTIAGCRLMRNGLSFEDCVSMRLTAGMKADAVDVVMGKGGY